jgi:hypothetical protein
MRLHYALPFLFAAACSTSSSSDDDRPELAAEDYDDTAQAIAATTAGDGNGGDLAAMSDSASIALGVVPLGFVWTGAGQIHGNRFGVDYTFTITCEDVNGNTLPTCSNLTDRAEVDVAWSGMLDTLNFDAAVERTGTWTLDGLQSNSITFEGDSSFSYDASLVSVFRPGARASFSFDADAQYDAIAIDGATHDAIAGTATFDISAHKVVTGTNHDVDKSFSVHAEVEFHADRTATITLDGDHHYTLNLVTGVVVRVD